MLSRFVSHPVWKRQMISSSSRSFQPSSSASCLFHTSKQSFDEEKTTADGTTAVAAKQLTPSDYLKKFGLDDWKLSAPLGIALAIPVLGNGMYVINEETQLACCFFLFCTSAYKFGGDMIGSYFDDKANAILREQNEVENNAIAIVKETIQSHRNCLEMVQDFNAVADAHKEVVEKLCSTLTSKLKHDVHDVFVKNLNSIIEYERAFDEKLQVDMVSEASKRVRSTISKGGKATSDLAFQHALNLLSNKASKDEPDAVVGLFSKELKSYAENVESQVGTVVQLSPQEMEDMQTKLNAYMKRNNIEAAELKAPKEVELGLLR